MSFYALAGVTATLLACGFGLWKGGKLEQAASVGIFVASIGTLFAQQDTGTLTPKFVFLAIDTVLLLSLAEVARRSLRSWPLFAVAFQLIKVIAHITALLKIEIGNFSYLSALAMADYGVLVTLTLGAWNAWRERNALDYAKL